MPGSFEPTVNCSYTMTPDILVNDLVVSFRVHELVHASTDPERVGLAKHRMLRLLAPHTQENPIFFHMTDSSTTAFKSAIDQMAEVGFEMLIYSFGSGFNIESTNETYIDLIAQDVAYANSKGKNIAYANSKGKNIAYANSKGKNIAYANSKGGDELLMLLVITHDSYIDLIALDIALANSKDKNVAYCNSKVKVFAYANSKGKNIAYANSKGKNIAYANSKGKNIAYANSKGKNIAYANSKGKIIKNIAYANGNNL